MYSVIETLKRLRKLNEEVPVYIVTAFHQEFFEELAAVRKDSIEFELMMKPVDRSQIQDVSRGILEDPAPFGGGAHV